MLQCLFPPPRLLLIPATLELLQGDMDGDAEFAKTLQKQFPGAQVQPGWRDPEYGPEATQWVLNALLETHEPDWWMYYYLLKQEDGTLLLIGNGGFKGPPDEEGRVEIGYAIAKEFQRQGLASEAARALVAWAFQDSRVTRVTAETLVGHEASIGVMEKCGMVLEGQGSEEGVVRYGISRGDRAA